jgi:hypothetical protein
MSDIRAEIRAILREEFAALRSEARASVETVRVTTTAELNRFSRDLVMRADSPEFSRAVAAGEITFELAGGAVPSPAATTAPPVAAPTFEKTLITERDIAGLDRSTKSLRLSKDSRLTPLARDEARRLGIRIERISS